MQARKLPNILTDLGRRNDCIITVTFSKVYHKFRLSDFAALWNMYNFAQIHYTIYIVFIWQVRPCYRTNEKTNRVTLPLQRNDILSAKIHVAIIDILCIDLWCDAKNDKLQTILPRDISLILALPSCSQVRLLRVNESDELRTNPSNGS